MLLEHLFFLFFLLLSYCQILLLSNLKFCVSIQVNIPVKRQSIPSISYVFYIAFVTKERKRILDTMTICLLWLFPSKTKLVRGFFTFPLEGKEYPRTWMISTKMHVRYSRLRKEADESRRERIYMRMPWDCITWFLTCKFLVGKGEVPHHVI